MVANHGAQDALDLVIDELIQCFLSFGISSSWVKRSCLLLHIHGFELVFEYSDRILLHWFAIPYEHNKNEDLDDKPAECLAKTKKGDGYLVTQCLFVWVNMQLPHILAELS